MMFQGEVTVQTLSWTIVWDSQCSRFKRYFVYFYVKHKLTSNFAFFSIYQTRNI